MPNPVWAAGFNIAAAFKAIGAAGFTVINILDWDWAPEVAELETMHSGSGGVDEAIAGRLAGKGTVHANYDIANPFGAAAPNINPGVKGILQLQAASLKIYQIPIMIVSVPIKGAVMGLVEFTFSYRLSGDVGTYIPLTS